MLQATATMRRMRASLYWLRSAAGIRAAQRPTQSCRFRRSCGVVGRRDDGTGGDGVAGSGDEAERRLATPTAPVRLAVVGAQPPRLVPCTHARTVSKQVSNKCIAVRKVGTPLRELTCLMGSHSVTCHPAEVTFPHSMGEFKGGGGQRGHGPLYLARAAIY